MADRSGTSDKEADMDARTARRTQKVADRAAKPWRLRFAILTALVVSACGPEASNKVTGQGPPAADPTYYFEQAETAIAVANFEGKQVITITFNDDTGTTDTIKYTETTRTTYAGASQVGWAYSVDRGTSWTYGGKLTPPPDWPILWGDPAITVSPADERDVYLSSLAVPVEKVPEGGIPGYLNDYIGGACIAHSSDGGLTFHVEQCVTNDHKFYDGGTMAAGNNGEVYAAYVRSDDFFHYGYIDVWGKAGPAGSFEMLPPPPFAPQSVVTHPWIHVDRIWNRLYLAAQLVTAYPATNRAVFLAYWDPNTGLWTGPVAATEPATEPFSIMLGANRAFRSGPQFAFDIGPPSSMTGEDNIRLLYTKRQDTGRYYVSGSYCNLSLQCHVDHAWGTGPEYPNMFGDQFFPNVAAPGHGSGSNVWKAAYLSREDDPTGFTVSAKQASLAVLPGGKRAFPSTTVVPSHQVCSDLRGYWGDYDDLQYIGQNQNGVHEFIRAYTDSSLGCVRRWEFTAQHMHVSAVVF
jgi:hypothetical protein